MKEIRFKHHKASSNLPLSTKTTFVTSDFIDFNSSQNGPGICDHVETLPSIPETSPELLKTLEELTELQKKCLTTKTKRRRATNQQPKVSKINGFTAFKSFYSRKFTALNQGVLSSYLSKVWVTEKNQHIWDLYAYLFRRYKRSESFSNWLVKNTNSQNLKVEAEDIIPNDVLSSTNEIGHQQPVTLCPKQGAEPTFQIPLEATYYPSAIMPYLTSQQPLSEKANLDNISPYLQTTDYQLSPHFFLLTPCFIAPTEENTIDNMLTDSFYLERQGYDGYYNTMIYPSNTQAYY